MEPAGCARHAGHALYDDIRRHIFVESTALADNLGIAAFTDVRRVLSVLPLDARMLATVTFVDYVVDRSIAEGSVRACAPLDQLPGDP